MYHYFQVLITRLSYNNPNKLILINNNIDNLKCLTCHNSILFEIIFNKSMLKLILN